MQSGKFRRVAANNENPLWNNYVRRCEDAYGRSSEIVSDFEKDYSRILNCTAYRRLKHKTQVFFATNHDHICTRIEHVNHVAAVSYSIAKFMGLNTELSNAIAIGHDLGHAPFGHEGERILRDIIKKEISGTYWHEKNSLKFVDELETITDQMGNEENLNLTYAVRDGIISHCGEVNENSLFPRQEYIDLNEISRPNEYAPYTWEGCVVKISDKISYLGRDIEDALTLKILSIKKIKELKKMVSEFATVNVENINNTFFMNKFTIDLCENSSIEEGLRFSNKCLQLLNSIKEFNYENIYNNKRLQAFKEYVRLIIKSIYGVLINFYTDSNIFKELEAARRDYPNLIHSFKDWLIKYSISKDNILRPKNYNNKQIYNIDTKEGYTRAVVDYITGMTDNFAIKIFQELIKFE
ncbi:deoxyguanosinetriphosphate triphosphohydrolase family protein [Clostridium neuense]|uniref:Deoxyguanosinetriphosphate triphosphohydrolase family protein n=1 Tax=Clostridium neuense TaxID=1728934 RepID=A0ABW8TEW4_9CLOT